MKLYLFTFSILFVSLIARGQWNYDNQGRIYDFNGNVGIGITNPQNKLQIGPNPQGWNGNDLVISNTINGSSNSTQVLISNALDHTMIYGSTDIAIRPGFGKWSIYSKGGNAYVGIGHNAPLAMLHVVQSNNSDWASIISNAGGSGKGLKIIGSSGDDSTPLLQVDENNNNTRFLVRGDGKVGFGTPTPAEVIHVNGNGRVNARIGRWASFGETHSGLATIIGTNVKASNAAVHRMEFIESTVDGGKAIKMQYDEGISFHTYLGNVTGGAEFNGYERMRIDNYGRVGIGTTSPDATLTVKGSIHTQEVKVDLLGAVAPDYVFEPTYELKSLSEVESYIKEHKHLPEVPSAKEMEEQGLYLKEMNMLLLKKVEELTLYVISIKSEVDSLRKENEELKKNVALSINKK